jgi:hypothetical protein
MVAAKNKRLDQIVDYLRAQSGPVQVSELAGLLECSERSVHRYIEQLRNQDVPISSFLGPGGGLVLRDLPAERSHTESNPNDVSSHEITVKTFIGRQAESNSLDRALESAQAGNGGIVALVGEAGIGKTRIAEEFSTRAEARGVEQVWCPSQESQSTPPYWPWIQAIRQLSDDSRKTATSELPADAIRRVESLVSGDNFADHADHALDANTERFLLLDSLFQYLVAAASAKSLAIILEDIHWADTQSLLLLEFFAPQIESSRILIIATARNWQHGTSKQTLNELARHPGFVRHDIAKLTKQETSDLVHTLGKHEPGVDEKVYQLSEGNAFFTVELSRLLATDSSKDSGRKTAITQLPETIVATITQRISGLSETSKLSLTFASVVGRQFELRELESIAKDDLKSPDVRASIDEAVSAGVVRGVDPKIPSYEFAHALIQKTIYDTTTATKRQNVHGRLAEYYDSAQSTKAGSSALKSAGEMAHHFIMSADRSKQAQIVKYSVQAGDEAEATYALDAAVDHYTSAVEYSNAQRPTPELGDLYFKLGIACRNASQADKAVDNYIAAFNVFESIGDTANAIKMSYQPIGRGPGEASHQIELCERGLKIVEKGSTDHARILNEMGSTLGSNHRQEEAIAALDNSTEIANGNEEPELAAHALLNLAATHLGPSKCAKGPTRSQLDFAN